MAFKLSLTPITDLHNHKIPIFHTQFLQKNPQRKLPCSKLDLRRNSSVCSNSLKQETIQNSTPTSTSSNKLVLVIGGTGGVGQLVVASLLNRDVKLRLLLRNPEKATTLFGEQEEDKLQVIKGDTRNSEELDPSMFEGVTHVICCTGTTAFPSRRWDGDNTPERVDWEGVRNLVSALPRSLSRIILVSSVGVTKSNELPWRCLDICFDGDYAILHNQNKIATVIKHDEKMVIECVFAVVKKLTYKMTFFPLYVNIMNLFGVLKYKKMGEDFVINSGIPYTIIRPGRLTDGPYTSYDLNTLLKATAGERRAVLIGQGDKLVGEVSRLVVAEACIQALDINFTEGQIYEINSVPGDGPGSDTEKWKELFKSAQLQSV